jgi:UDP-glucose 4-epimerase
MGKVLRDEEVPLFDDGEQTRDFTYCGDIVDGLVSAATYPGMGDIFNLGGGSRVSVLNAIAVIEKISGRKIKIARYDRQKGDVRHTSARLDHARARLNYSPRIGLEQGLQAEWDWVRSLSD